MPSVTDVIVHCQKQIKKTPPPEKLLHYLSRLDRLRVTVTDLMETGIGRTVNQLSRHDGDVGHVAMKLVHKWKAMVSADENSDSEDSASSSSTEDEENEDGDDFIDDNSRDESDSSMKIDFVEEERNNKIHDGHQERFIKQETESMDEEESSRAGFIKLENESMDEEESSRAGFIKQEHESMDEEESGGAKDKHSSKQEEKSKKEVKEERKHSHKHKHKDRHEKEQRMPKDNSHGEKRKNREHEKDDRKRESESMDKEESSRARFIKRESEGVDKEEISRVKDKHSSKQEEKSKKEEKYKKEVKEERKHSSKHKHKDRHDKEQRTAKDNGEKRKDREHEKDDRKRKSKESTRSHGKKIKTEDEPKGSSKPEKPKIAAMQINGEIDYSSGVNFDDVLGSLYTSSKKGTSSKKIKDNPKSCKSSVIQSGSSSKEAKEEVTTLVRRSDLDRASEDRKRKYNNKNLESVIVPMLNISPHYKPSAAASILSRPPIQSMPPRPMTGSLKPLELCDPGNYWEDSRITLNHPRELNAEDALASMITSRNQRTKVFSGSKITCTGEVPKLYDLCMQVIQDNIQDLGYTGGVPYDILKPAVERATASQLLQIEECNPYFVEDTDDLWRFHCRKDFKGLVPQEFESWRELYQRCVDERAQKFAVIKKKMLRKVEVAEPQRKAKLAYVEPIGGPRFSKQKAATIKNGMKSLKIKEEKGPKKGVGTSASAGFNNPTDQSRIVEEQAILINPKSKAGHAPAPAVSREPSNRPMKSRKPPLMAKTMRFIKSLHRR